MTKHVIKRTPTNVIWDETEVYGGELDDVAELLNEEVTLAFGRNRMDMKWQTGPIQLGSIVRQLCDHKVSKNKDGKCLTQGALVSKRRQMNNVSSLDLLILDMDTGQPIEEVRERLLQEGLMAVIYTTHSYGATSSLVMENKLMSTMEVTRDEIKAGGASIDTLVQDYFSTYMKYHKSITDGMKYVETKQVEGGIKVFVKHPPMQKYRIVMVLDEPYSFTDLKNGKDQRSAILKWKSKYAGVAELLNASFDTSCTDPSRLFYLPTHKKDGEYHTEIIIGDTLILEDIKAGNPKGHTITNAYLDAADDSSDGRTRSSIDWLNSWASKNMKLFQAADFMLEYGGEELNIHQNGSAMTGMCPCDDRHSNPGDPNDSGFYCFNPDPDGDENKQYGYMGCSHNGCTEFGTTSFIEGLMEIGILSDSKEEVLKELNDFVEDKSIPFDVDDEDAVEPAKKAAKKQGDEPKTSTKSNTSKKKEVANKAAKNMSSGTMYDRIRLTKEDFEQFPKKAQKMIQRVLKVPFANSEASDQLLEKMVDMEIEEGVALIVCDYLCVVSGFGKTAIKKQYQKIRKVYENEYQQEKLKDELQGTPKVNSKGDFGVIVDETLQGLAKLSSKDPKIFVMDGVGMSRIVISEESDVAYREIMGTKAITSDLHNLIYYYGEGPNSSIINVPPPRDLVTHLEGCLLSDLPFPLLSSIVSHPIFAADGRLHVKNGYDKNTACYLHTSFTPLPVPSNPSDADLDAAFDLLDEIFEDFPIKDRRADEDYIDQGQASRANLYALLLQPFVGNIIGDEPTPLFVLDKSLPSAGATLMANVFSTIIVGEKTTKTVYTNDEEEFEKKLISKLKRTPDGLMYFDNINMRIDNPAFAMALTSDNFAGRLLGGNVEFRSKINHAWIASGNNLSFSNEISRRCVPISILPAMANPGSRTGFRHSDLLLWVMDNRAEIIQALCVIIQSWIDNDMPNWVIPEKATALGSYNRWAEVMGGILQNSGIEGFLENITDLREDSSEDMDGGLALINAIIECASGLDKGVLVKDLHNTIWDEDARSYENLDSLSINCTRGAGEARKGLGYAMRSLKDRPVVIDTDGGELSVQLTSVGKRSNAILWGVIKAPDQEHVRFTKIYSS